MPVVTPRYHRLSVLFAIAPVSLCPLAMPHSPDSDDMELAIKRVQNGCGQSHLHFVRCNQAVRAGVSSPSSVPTVTWPDPSYRRALERRDIFLIAKNSPNRRPERPLDLIRSSAEAPLFPAGGAHVISYWCCPKRRIERHRIRAYERTFRKKRWEVVQSPQNDFLYERAAVMNSFKRSSIIISAWHKSIIDPVELLSSACSAESWVTYEKNSPMLAPPPWCVVTAEDISVKRRAGPNRTSGSNLFTYRNLISQQRQMQRSLRTIPSLSTSRIRRSFSDLGRGNRKRPKDSKETKSIPTRGKHQKTLPHVGGRDSERGFVVELASFKMASQLFGQWGPAPSHKRAKAQENG
ncbi:hypothetical protein BJY52DRAFT_1402233 [Lactarius psammicola]|nr:hypothetical protein BJY52DRAFT_1402233 [Lactarius psammicola]